MIYEKIKKVITQITKEEEKKELNRIKSAVKTNFEGFWGDYTEVINSAGESYKINKKLTPLQQKKPLKEQKEQLAKNVQKKYNKILTNYLNKLDAIASADNLKDFSISIEWTAGSVYGWQARAELREHTENGFKYYEGTKTGGCGYDKRSTATASVLNQSKPILKLILNRLEKQPLKTIKKHLSAYDCREFLGYGLYLKGLSFFCGGVGFSSHEHILNNLNIKTITHHETKTNDYFYFEYKPQKGARRDK